MEKMDLKKNRGFHARTAGPLPDKYLGELRSFQREQFPQKVYPAGVAVQNLRDPRFFFRSQSTSDPSVNIRS